MRHRFPKRVLRKGGTVPSSCVVSSSFALFLIVLVGGFLWWSGNTPRETVQAVVGWRTPSFTATTEQWLYTLIAAFAWVIILLVALLMMWRLITALLRAVRTLAEGVQERSPQTFLGVFLTFFVGSHGASMQTFTSVAPSNEQLQEVEPVHDTDSQLASPVNTQSSYRILPALASAGLALGVTKHIQRERAMLLRDAPSSAQLRRPDTTSLTTGISLFERAESAKVDIGQHDAACDSPIVVPLGVAQSHLVSLVVKPGEVVSVDGPTDEGHTVLRHLVNTVALAPWLQRPLVVAVGFSREEFVVDRGVLFAESPLQAKQLALRARDEDRASTVIVVAKTYSDDLDDLPHHGVMVVSTGWTQAQKVTRVIRENAQWRISTTNETFLPYGILETEARSIGAASRAMTRLEMSPQSSPLHTQSRIDIGHHLTTHPSAVLMRVLGPVQVFSANQEVTFRKGKALELLCWLAFHRECPTVSGARTALWEIDVKDATFHNVLSELRHGLSSVGLPEGARRVTKQRLFLDERVSTDADVLREMLLNAESSADAASIHHLSETLSMVQGLPFGSMGYAWADAEGITATLVWRVTRAVELVARFAAVAGDRTALLEAVSAGLRMSPGDDDFLALQELAIA